MGAGLVGLDTVSGLLENDVKPVVVELADHLLCRQLDKKAAAVYEAAMSEKGVRQYYGTGVQELFCDREGNVKELLLSDGSRIPCDLLIVTAGDFFASKSTMNFFGIPTMSLGQAEPQDETELVETQEGKDGYKKIIHKNGRILGAIIQGDLSYSGVLQQLIARRIDVSRVKKPIFEIDYSDFFHVGDNFEYYYQEDIKDE